MMNNITMKHLRYFDALARTRHFGNAAKDCGITQPALSNQIKELEGLSGAALVERSTRQVHLTALGIEFAIRTRDILASVNELEDLVRAKKAPFFAELNIGFIPTIAPYILPQIIRVLMEHFPHARMRPREAMTATLVDDLISGSLDLAMVALPVSEPSLQEHALFEEEFLLVRPPGAGSAPLPTAEDLSQSQVLLLREGHCFRDQALSYCQSRSATPNDVVEGSSLSTLVGMVSVGMGVTLIPEMAAAVETRLKDVSISRFANPVPKRTVGLVWRKSNPLKQQFMQFAELIQSVRDIPMAGTKLADGPETADTSV